MSEFSNDLEDVRHLIGGGLMALAVGIVFGSFVQPGMFVPMGFVVGAFVGLLCYVSLWTLFFR